MKRFLPFLAVGVAMPAILAPVAAAQAGAQSGPSSQAGGDVVPTEPADVYSDEIIVTANKRAESLQDVPKSVQVVGAQSLQQQNVTSIGDLQKLVPTIAGSGQTLAIRGIGTGASALGAQNKVGLVLDDVPQPSRATLANNLLDIERVEVLPGPQGTLAGRNATGGLVNLVTRGPSSQWTGFANGMLTSDGQQQLALFVAGPVSDKVQISSSQYFNRFRGLVKNIALDKWSGNYVVGTRNKVRIQATDALTVTLTGFYQHSEASGLTLFPPFASVAPGTFYAFDIRFRPFSELQPGVRPSDRNNELSSIYDGQQRTTIFGGILRSEYETDGGVTLTSITSYSKEREVSTSDFASNVVSLADLNIRPEWDGYIHVTNGARNVTQELRVNSPATGPFTYVAGLFLSNQRLQYDYTRFVLPVDWRRDFNSRTMAAYAHAEYDVTERLRLLGGVRFEHDKVDYNWIFLPIGPATKVTSDGVVRNYPAINNLRVSSGKDQDSFINFDIGAQYRFSPDLMTYITYAKANQGPVYDAEDNTSALNGTLETLPQERVSSIEAGVKAQFFDRRLTANLSLYSAQYDNYQVSTSVVSNDPNSVPVLRLAAVGKVRTRGAELNTSLRADERLMFNLNLAYMDAKILDFPNAPCFGGAPIGPLCSVVNAGTAQQFTTQGNLAGRSLNRAPKLRLTAGFDYSVPVGADGLQLFVAPLVKYAGAQRTDLLGDPLSSLPATTYVNVNAGVRGGTFVAEMFVQNLFKEWAQIYSSNTVLYLPNNRSRVSGLDRQNNRYIGGRLRYNF